MKLDSNVMWNSTSQKDETGVLYKAPELDALMNYIGSNMAIYEDAESGLLKDEECEFHYCHYLNGITNGEYVFAIFHLLSEMTKETPGKTPAMYQEAVLASVLDGLEEDFLTQLSDGNFSESSARDIWNLFSSIRKRCGMPVWTDDDDNEIPDPALVNLAFDDWTMIFEMIHDEFLWDRDWELDLFGGTNFALLQEQPHFPTIQEYRTAKTWIRVAYSRTGQNLVEASHARK